MKGRADELAQAIREKHLKYETLDSRAFSELVGLAADAERCSEDLEREREIWSVQSRVIKALAAEVPDDVRARVLAPLRALREATDG